MCGEWPTMMRPDGWDENGFDGFLNDTNCPLKILIKLLTLGQWSWTEWLDVSLWYCLLEFMAEQKWQGNAPPYIDKWAYKGSRRATARGLILSMGKQKRGMFYKLPKGLSCGSWIFTFCSIKFHKFPNGPACGWWNVLEGLI